MRVNVALLLTALVGLGCGTDAVGVSACREIEQARCEASVPCGYPDVSACQRFYRDHCLHGLEVDEVQEIDVQACTASIAAAGRCAREQSPDLAPAECPEAIQTSDAAATVCDVVLRPEEANACTFLIAPAPMPSDENAGGG